MLIDEPRDDGVTGWSEDDLARLAGAQELELASARPDGTLRPYVTIWAVRVGDGLYVRSAHGPGNPWYRHALAAGTGRIRAGGLERDVDFVAAGDDTPHAGIDAAYHAKYDPTEPEWVAPVVGGQVVGVTLRLVPAHGDRR